MSYTSHDTGNVSPEDIWLYNSADCIYRGVDNTEAHRWCVAGLELAITPGDLEQLSTGRRETCRANQWADVDAADAFPLPVRARDTSRVSR